MPKTYKLLILQSFTFNILQSTHKSDQIYDAPKSNHLQKKTAGVLFELSGNDKHKNFKLLSK